LNETTRKAVNYMRFITKSACLALIAACSLSAVAVASASASEFTFSKAGTLKGASTTTQALTTADGRLECKDAVSGSVSGTGSTTLKVTVQYESCAAFGLEMKFSPAEYEYNANGAVTLLKAVTGKATSCEIVIPAQTLSGMQYSNAAGKLEATANVTHIASEGKKAACEYAKEAKGTLTGTSLVELVGGTLEIS
jgi:hypothetical protein